MSIEALTDLVDKYFETHLDRVFWKGLAIETRTGAVAMAANDIAAAVPGLHIGLIDTIAPAMNAVAEQAVFLARNYENMNEGKVMTGEGVEGISNSYTLLNASGISFRAEPFIKQAKRAVTGASVRITRG